MIYSNNTSKTKRSMKKEGKDVEYAEFRSIFSERAGEWKTYFRYIDGRTTNLTRYIKIYKKQQLITLKQVFFSPIDRIEGWEIKDKKLSFRHILVREVNQRGIEMLYTHSISVVYKNIEIQLNNPLWEEFDLLGVYQEVSKFFRMLTNYKKEVIK